MMIAETEKLALCRLLSIEVGVLTCKLVVRVELRESKLEKYPGLVLVC